jgi:hypothetical protein
MRQRPANDVPRDAGGRSTHVADSRTDVSRRDEVEKMAGACLLDSLVNRVDSSCRRIRNGPAPRPAPPVLLEGVKGRVPRGLTDLDRQLVAGLPRDPERGEAPRWADPEPVEGGASHGSRQRTSRTGPAATGPPARTVLHNGNRLVGCRAVENRMHRRDGRRHLPREMGPVQPGACVCRGAESAWSFPAVDSPDGERRRGEKPHGRPIRSKPISTDRTREDPVPNVGPCGGVKGHERKQPDRTTAWGGYEQEHVKTHNERV